MELRYVAAPQAGGGVLHHFEVAAHRSPPHPLNVAGHPGLDLAYRTRASSQQEYSVALLSDTFDASDDTRSPGLSGRKWINRLDCLDTRLIAAFDKAERWMMLLCELPVDCQVILGHPPRREAALEAGTDHRGV